MLLTPEAVPGTPIWVVAIEVGLAIVGFASVLGAVQLFRHQESGRALLERITKVFLGLFLTLVSALSLLAAMEFGLVWGLISVVGSLPYALVAMALILFLQTDEIRNQVHTGWRGALD